MKKFILAVVVLLGLGTAWAAEYQSANFTVEASTATLAENVANKAEDLRVKYAELWIGKRLAKLEKRCAIRVTDATCMHGSTTITNNIPVSMELYCDASTLDTMIQHEMTHAVITQRFACRISIWADEGCAVSDETDKVKNDIKKKCKTYHKEGKLYRLAILLDLKDYPRDSSKIWVFYAESYSITQYLIDKKDGKAFLDFVEYGMAKGWNGALSKYYDIKTVEDLETEWLKTID